MKLLVDYFFGLHGVFPENRVQFLRHELQTMRISSNPRVINMHKRREQRAEVRFKDLDFLAIVEILLQFYRKTQTNT